ncbi:DUF5606 domain-containing protein [Leadbetterella byssophila]|uniref:Uncharacterized protein n=1 Tax=Leadbetterella byssophila (strain DSM 17132 / JCM 16389 / KACC 11308 / NBRC 106382 / 4M15) TaxID=649349 RepID=E4RQY0_LEAB4|nr:DUF5606 domain-containing protein [Leadbetterella byssophila]ADQ18423.1 hypothetical protein Lbys_2761 [Leadbetterella byssophila DSM 17132]
MELLQEVANISGRPGLYRIVKPGRGGVIVESLDASKKREMINANAKVSVLKEISVYTENVNESKPLSEIFLVIREKHGEKVDFDMKNASNKDYFDFFETVLPEFDKERVYATDVKKIINWYNTLSQFLPEIFEETK